MSKSNSVFMRARCLTYNKVYYLRYDYNAMNRWILSETLNEEEYRRETAANQGGKNKEINVSNAKDGPQYRGCPYCGNRGFVTCSSCSDLHCFDGHSDGFMCPSDQKYHKLSGGYISSLKGKRAGQ